MEIKLPTKKHRGRPFLRKGEGKEAPISVRLTAEEREIFQKEANKEGIKLSSWIRKALLTLVKKGTNLLL
jgi:hypothetical protein